MVVNKDRLHDFQVSNALCAAARDTNQYVAVHLLPEEIASILAPCHSMASSRSCLLSCRANCIPMYKLKSIMSTVHADCCIFTRHPDSYSSIQINGGVVDIISTLIFDRRAGQRQPLFSPANGQIFISTRQRKACRGLVPLAA